ncbi:MAG: metallophosphoesterase [Bacteroidales bacterium]|nr:metallophosphoesterase [Bacteroidales bacterium]
MHRIVLILLAALGLALPRTSAQVKADLRGIPATVYQNGQKIRIFSPDVSETVRIFVISDTHIFRSDEREDPFREYSDRMAKAYNSTKHFLTGEKTNPEESLLKTLELAKEHKADVIALTGDMVSFPSEAGVEWVKNALDACGIPWFYTTGNHDWHYEGMEGTEQQLRETWTQKRLLPLYQGHDHKLYSAEVKGVKLIFLDNGIYEILPEQLDAFKKEVKGTQPKLLFSHIPFYAPGYSTSTVAHPKWGLAVDKNYKIERRLPWPEEGFGKTTVDFWKAILKASRKNGLLATFSGHLHTQQSSVIGPWVQFTVPANAVGGYFEVTEEPL